MIDINITEVTPDGLVTWRWKENNNDCVAVTKGLHIPQSVINKLDTESLTRLFHNFIRVINSDLYLRRLGLIPTVIKPVSHYEMLINDMAQTMLNIFRFQQELGGKY